MIADPVFTVSGAGRDDQAAVGLQALFTARSRFVAVTRCSSYARRRCCIEGLSMPGERSVTSVAAGRSSDH
ncbi:MAG UNVERIFIED_CONTAM: hypothetical protein LVR18_02930 [Planctomycetaceae bacterium]